MDLQYFPKSSGKYNFLKYILSHKKGITDYSKYKCTNKQIESFMIKDNNQKDFRINIDGEVYNGYLVKCENISNKLRLIG